MFALCNNRFSLEIRFDDVTVARNSATAVSKPYYSTKAHSSEPTAHARSSFCTYMLSWPLIDEKMGEEKKEKKRKERRDTQYREKKRNFTPSLGHFRFFSEGERTKREREKPSGLEGYTWCVCVLYTTSTTLTANSTVYTVGPYNHSACLIGVEINLWLRGFSQKTTENLVNRKKEKKK